MEKLTKEEWIANFIEMWESRPLFVVRGKGHLLARDQSFIAGLQWASLMQELGQGEFIDFLCGIEGKMTQHLTGNDGVLGWYEHLMELADNDDDVAHKKFIELLREIGEKTNYRE